MRHSDAYTDQEPLRSPAFSIHSGIESISELFKCTLVEMGLAYSVDASTILVIDAPQGWAIRRLLDHDYRPYYTVVVTVNDCPEYIEDLWDLEPTILLVGDNLLPELSRAITRVSTGERYRILPACSSSLTPSERVLLRLIAHGWSNEQIARARKVAVKTIRNSTSELFRKLQLADRVAASLYYWGCRDCVDPPDIANTTSI